MEETSRVYTLSFSTYDNTISNITIGIFLNFLGITFSEDNDILMQFEIAKVISNKLIKNIDMIINLKIKFNNSQLIKKIFEHIQ